MRKPRPLVMGYVGLSHINTWIGVRPATGEVHENRIRSRIAPLAGEGCVPANPIWET